MTAGNGEPRANWLPAPTGTFHLILRLYQPTQAALSGTWKPAPVLRADETLAPAITRLRISPATFRPAGRGAVTAAHGRARVTYVDSQATATRFVIMAIRTRARCHAAEKASCAVDRVITRFSRRDHVGTNHFFLTGRAHGARLKPGRYRLQTTRAASATSSASRASVTFRIR